MTDDHVRLAALAATDSILLQAPAGSGKTTVLAQRFLGLLAAVDEPEELLAITFTRKAAAEMRERVLRALEGTLESSAATAPLWSDLRERVLAQAARRGWSLQELAARLRIQTIDSLNHEIARAMPVLGRFQASLQVVDDATSLYLQAARETLRDIDAEPEFAGDADLLLLRLDNQWERAAELLAGLLASRSRWLPVLLRRGPEQLAAAVEESLDRIIAATLEAAQRWPLQVLEEGAALARASAAHRERRGLAPGNWQRWLQPQASLAPRSRDLLAWRALTELALVKTDIELRKQVDKNLGFPPEDPALKARWRQWIADLGQLPEVAGQLHLLRALPDPLLSGAERQAVAALGRVLLRAAATLLLVMRDRGRVDHTEVAAVARQALASQGEVTDQAIRQTLRIRHLLVDEFQDVSPDQLQLLAALTSDWSEGDGRSLFLVGDPMQSIYQFRDAEVGLFLRTRERGIGALRPRFLQLSRNFRSQGALVSWVNSAFTQVFPGTDDARRSAVAFLASRAAREDDGPAVTVWPYAPDSAAAEAAAIAAEIARLRDAATKRPRIAILLRDRTLAGPILNALRQHGVPWLGVDLARLSERGSVRDLVSLGSALCHAGDRAAWLAVLRAPFCGLSLADLHALNGEPAGSLLIERLADPDVAAGLSDEGRARLSRCAPLLLTAWRERGRDDPATAMEGLWRALGGPEACRDDADLAAAGQYLQALRALLEDEPRPDAARLRDLAARLREAAPAGSGSEGDAVEVLTIHHAKGLEWDVVFVPGLGKPPRTSNTPLMRWLELPGVHDEDDLLLAVRSIGADNDSDPLARFIALLQRERTHHERMRLAYVAVTRARERLYLSGESLTVRPGESPRPASGSLLSLLWPAVAPAFDAAAAAPAPQHSAPREGRRPTPVWRRVPVGFDPALGRDSLPEVPGIALQSEAAAARPEYRWVGPLARAAGTLVHEELERMARADGLAGTDIQTRREHYHRRLLELGASGGEAASVADVVISRLQELRGDATARWLLDPAHTQSQCELRLSGLVDGQLRNAVIDRSFIDAQGERWVIDYKTSTHAGGGLDAFLDAEEERYGPQLRLYRTLAKRLGPEPLRVALYFPWLGVLREVRG